MLSTPEYPADLGGRSARVPPSAVAGWPRLPRPAKPNGISKLQIPANKLRKKDRGVRRVHRDVEPTAGGSVYDGCVLDYGMAMELPGRALGVQQAAVVVVQEGVSHSPTTANRSVHASLRGRALLHCWPRVVSHGHHRRRACVGVHLGGIHLRE